VSPVPERLRIASRKSRLALWQSEHVAQRLRACYPDLVVDVIGMSTEGDRVLDRPLHEIGGKGLFTKELEFAILRGDADFAVHSLKDVPMRLEDGFTLAAVLEREDPCDAWVSTDYPARESLPQGATVGTSSLRRESQLRAWRPDLRVVPLRGNLDTRLAKLDRGEYHGIVLAAAGLRRLDLHRRIAAILAPDDMLPAAGQAALALECLIERRDVVEALSVLEHLPTLLAVSAERALCLRLGGNCKTPLAAYAEFVNQQLHLRGCVADATGRLLSFTRTTQVANLEDARALGATLAQTFLDAGLQPWSSASGPTW
jgi:hydroxymethylbilane synthase